MKIITNVELFEALRSVSAGRPGHGKRGHGHHGADQTEGYEHHHSKCSAHHGETEGHLSEGKGCKHRHGREDKGNGRCNRARQGSRERILIHLLELPYGVKQKDLVELLGIKPASISEQIDILEAHGHVNKITDENDKRATVISLTDQGVEKAKSALVEREKEQLFTLLNKLNDK